MAKESLIGVGALCFLVFSSVVFAEKPGFDFSTSQDQVVLVAGATSSCQGINSGFLDTRIAANYLQLDSLKVHWNSSHPLTIQSIRFAIQNAEVNHGEAYICTLAGTDLLNTWVMGWNVKNPETGGPLCITAPQAPHSVTVVAGVSPDNADSCNVVGTTNSCPFSCGGINMTNPRKSSEGELQVTVFASYQDDNGFVQSIESTKPLSYRYTGFIQ